MKKIMCASLSAMLLLSGCSQAATEEADETEVEEVTGGWQINEDETMAVLPESVQNAFDKACEEYVGMGFTPIAYLGSQVVSGTNYKLLCKGTTVTATPETKLVTVTIYEDLDGNAQITDVLDFDITALVDETTEENLMGGWQINTDYAVVNLPAEVESPFTEATSQLLGVNYEPLALLASQIVAGTNYAILCHTSTVSDESTEGLAVVVVYAGIDGTNEVVSVSQLNLANL